MRRRDEEAERGTAAQDNHGTIKEECRDKIPRMEAQRLREKRPESSALPNMWLLTRRAKEKNKKTGKKEP